MLVLLCATDCWLQLIHDLGDKFRALYCLLSLLLPDDDDDVAVDDEDEDNDVDVELIICAEVFVIDMTAVYFLIGLLMSVDLIHLNSNADS